MALSRGLVSGRFAIPGVRSQARHQAVEGRHSFGEFRRLALAHAARQPHGQETQKIIISGSFRHDRSPNRVAETGEGGARCYSATDISLMINLASARGVHCMRSDMP